MLPSCKNRAFFETVSACLLYSLKTWVNQRVMKSFTSALTLSFQQCKLKIWSFPLWFNQSITILESPKTWRFWIWSWVATVRSAQPPKSSTLLFVLNQQFRVHMNFICSSILITPPSPLFIPQSWSNPSNHPIVVPPIKH